MGSTPFAHCKHTNSISLLRHTSIQNREELLILFAFTSIIHTDKHLLRGIVNMKFKLVPTNSWFGNMMSLAGAGAGDCFLSSRTTEALKGSAVQPGNVAQLARIVNQ